MVNHSKWRFMSKLRLVTHVFISILFALAFLSNYTGFASTKDNLMVLKVNGSIQPSTADYLERMIAKAGSSGSTGILIELNTPGGMLNTTRRIVSAFLDSDVPIITYVSPFGARAGSAGTFLVAASHIAAMAPTTNIGAASPVSLDGSDLNKTLASKATQDTAALMRSIAETRGRNVKALEATVLSAKAYSSEEALETGIIDYIAEDRDQLLAILDGKTVVTKSGSRTISTVPLNLYEGKRNWKEKFLDAVGDPNITFILLTIGSIALTIEFVNPGVLVGGFVGLLATALAFVGMGQLPVNWFAMVLVMAALILFVIETQGAGIGLFAIGGTICFGLGGFLLYGDFGDNSLQGNIFSLSMWLLGSVILILSVLVLFLIVALRDSMARGSPSNYSTLIGSEGIVRSTLNPNGTVLVGSEMWSATSLRNLKIASGRSVVVSNYDGVQLIVSKKPEEF
jgi:membrane-bound serine protease (ClpP class)